MHEWMRKGSYHLLRTNYIPSVSHYMDLFNPNNFLWGKYCHTHFIDEKTDDPRSVTPWIVESVFEQRTVLTPKPCPFYCPMVAVADPIFTSSGFLPFT